MRSFLESVQAERSGIAAACVVFVVCLVISVLVWIPLNWLVRATEWLVPIGGCGRIREFTPTMFACASVIGALTLVRTVLIMAALYFIFRALIARGVDALIRRVPPHAQFLLAPAFATALFVMPWAAAHSGTANMLGIVPQKWFPAFVGLFTFAVGRFGADVQARLGDFFERRERYSPRARLGIVAAAALLLSVILGYVSRNFAWREQVILLFCMVAFGLALMPRTGELLPPIRRPRAGDTRGA